MSDASFPPPPPQPPAGPPPQGPPPGMPPQGPPPGFGPGPGLPPQGPPSGGGRGKLVIIGVVAVLVLALLGVGGVVLAKSLGGGPEDTADQLLDATDFVDPDYLTQCELATPALRKQQFAEVDAKDCAGYDKNQTKAFKDLVKESPGDGCDLTFAQLYKKIDYKYDIGKVTEKEGDKATVAFTTTLKFNGTKKEIDDCLDGDEDTITSKGKVELSKIDGDWRVASISQQ